jgi:anti-anti-sigma factor
MRLDRLFSLRDNVDNVLNWESDAAIIPTTTSTGEWAVYRLPRRLDGHSVQDVAAACQRLLEENSRLILDFSLTDFLTSAGLALLVRLQRQAESDGGALRLAGCNRDVHKVLQMVRFDLVFAIFTDVQRAAEANLEQKNVSNKWA